MIIYSVIRTCNYDGESLVLFTSLRKAVNYAIDIHQEFLAGIDDEDYHQGEVMNLDYHIIKKSLNDEAEHNTYHNSTYIDGHFTIEITKHDSSNPMWFNGQHGGF